MPITYPAVEHIDADPRGYYGGYLERLKGVPDQPVWGGGPQQVPFTAGQQAQGLLWGLGGIGALAAAGSIPLSGGGRVWDYYLKGIRAAEEYSPGQVLRTFQLSNILAPLGTAAQAPLTISSEMMGAMAGTYQGQAYLNYLSKLTGRSMLDPSIMDEGIAFAGGQLRTATSGKVLLERAATIPVEGSTRFMESYARSLGAGVVGGMFRAEDTLFEGKVTKGVPFGGRVIVGGAGGMQAAGRMAGAAGTEMVERFHRLLKSPFEMEPFKSTVGWLEKPRGFWPGLKLGVESGKGLQTFGRIALKLGVYGPLAYAGYQYLDYATRNTELLDSTIFGEGITAGVATAWAKTNLAWHYVADATGLQAYGRWQEEVAPGSTDLSRLLGFPLTGLIGGVTAQYLRKAALQVRLHAVGREIVGGGIEKFASAAAAGETATAMLSFTEKGVGMGWFSKLGRRWAEKGAIWGIGKAGPSKLAALVGAAAGAALTLPFIPGALAPELTAEELEDLYMGKREVPVRAGQFWEFGRQPWTGGKVQFFTPHWYRRLLDRPREKGVWGPLEEERGGEIPPHERWLIKEFTYELEKAHYRDRPYPVTGTALEDVPFVGPALAGTIGRLIKPPLRMHSEDWLRGGGLDREGEGEGAGASREALAAWNEGQALHLPRGFGERRELEAGEIPPGMPVSPYGLQGLAGDQWYRLTEMVGLPGFIFTALKEKMTGTPDLFDQLTQLESSRRMFGSETGYWSWTGLQIGGGAGSTELIRRLYPHRRRCLLPSTRVLLANGGVKSVESVLPGDVVPTHSGHVKPVLEGTSREIDEEIVCVRTKYNNQILKLTKDHLVRTIRTHHCTVRGISAEIPCQNRLSTCNKRECTQDFFEHYIPEWIPAGDLTSLDYVQVPVRIYSRENEDTYILTEKYISDVQRCTVSTEKGWLRTETLTKGRGGSKRRRYSHTAVKTRLELDEDFGRYLGLYLAEGSRSGASLGFAFSTTEETYRRFVDQFTRRICKSYLRKAKVSGREDCSHRGVINQKVYSLPVAILLSRLVGGIASTKRIAPELMVPNQNFLLGILIGYLQGDGCVHQKGATIRVSSSTASEELIYQLRDIAFFLGYTPSIGCREREGFGTIEVIWELSFEGEDALDLARRIEKRGISQSIRTKSYSRRVLKRKEGIYIQVQSIVKEQYTGRVYNLEVAGEQSFATGVCVVHNSIDLHNSIRNLMPTWLPGPGERSPNFLYADPYLAVPMGEYRLPGPGYVARYPELEGVDPADYPLLHRYRILQDVAPYSTQADAVKKELSIARNAGLLTEEEEAMYQEVQRQQKEKRERREFHEYKYREREYIPEREKLIEAAGEEGPGIVGRMLGTYWEELSHKAETPFEYLTPLAPAHKLIHMRSAVEDYEAMQVRGGEAAFWQHPWTHFWRPFLTTSAGALGADDVPDHIKAKREVQDYFDALKYLKHLRLERIARAHGDTEAAMEFARVQRETLTGLNPYGYNFQAIFRALPRSERDYFNSFVKADLNEREEIERLVPENQRALYEAMWEMADTEDRKKAIKKGLLSSREEEQARGEIDRVYSKAGTEGLPTSRELWAEYLATRLRGESYADWYRRVYLLAEKLQGKAVPGPDWVGWHPSVDLEDIRLKVVESLGQDLHDHDLWPSRRTQMAHRPYINDEAVRAITDDDERLSKEEVGRRIKDLLSSLDVPDAFVSVTSAHPAAELDRIDMHFQEDRLEEAREMFRREGMAH